MNSMPSDPSNKPPLLMLRRYRRILLMLLALLLILGLLPFGIQWGASKALKDLGASQVSIEDVDFNPFTAELVIEGLHAKGPQGEILELDHFLLDWSWLPLLKKRIEVQRLEMSDAVFDLQQDAAGVFALGGFRPPEPEAGSQTKPPEEEGSTPWGIRVSSVDLSDILVRYADPKIQRQARLERLALGDIASWEPKKPAPYEILLHLPTGIVRLEGETQPFNEARKLRGSIDIRGMALGWTAPLLRAAGLSDFDATLDMNMELIAELGPEGPRARIDGRLTVSALKVQLEKSSLSLAANKVGWKGMLKLGEEGEKGLEGLYSLADLNLAGLRIDDLEKGRNLLGVEGGELTALEIQGPGSVQLEQLLLQGTRLLERSVSELEDAKHSLAIGQVVVAGIEADPNKVRLRLVRLDTAGVRITRDSEGTLDLLSWLPEEKAGEVAVYQASGGNSSQVASEPISLHLDELVIGGESNLHFTDQSVTPGFDLRLNPIDLRLGPFDTRVPGASNLDLAVGVERYGRLKLNGQVALLAEKPTLHLKGELRGISLPPLSPYAAQAIDYNLKLGEFGTSIQVDIIAGIIDSHFDVEIDKLELTQEGFTDGGVLTGPLGMSVEAALSLVRDKNGRVDLSLPVKGDLSSPDVRFKSLLVKATGTAVRNAAKSHFASLGVTLLTGVVLPPGTLYVAEKMVEYATTMRFKPVEYDPLIVTLTSPQQAYLKEMATALLERPETSLVVCAWAGGVDLEMLRQKAMAEPQKTGAKPVAGVKKEAGEPLPIQPTEEETLKKLAESRALGIKDYLILQRIEADRVLVCIPQIDLESSPHVEISL